MRKIAGSLFLVGCLVFAIAAKHPTPPQQKSKEAKGAKAGAVAGFGNADAITQDELKVYDYFLASDQLEGRYLPSRGYDTAALYVASHLKEWGLTPGGSTTGTDGPLQPYFMPFDLVASSYETAGMKLSLTSPAPAVRGGRGGRAAAPAAPRAPVTRDFDYTKEWTVGAGGGGRGGAGATAANFDAAPLVFVGNGYVINKTNTNPYQGIDVRDKVMVVAGVPAELAAQAAAAAGGRGGARGGRGPNPLGVAGTDFMTPQEYALKNGARAIILVPTFAQLSTMANADGGGAFGGRGGGRGAQLNASNFQVAAFQASATSVPTITAGIELTNALFQGEQMSASQIFDGAAANAKLASFAFNAEKSISVHLPVTTEHNHAENVVGILEGSDPVLKNEYVFVTAHLDHIGLSQPENGDGINNGADDDGSGSTGLLGLAHAYAEGAAKGLRPKRTIVFMWEAGEERGLWGSEYFNRFPFVDIHKVVVDLNMDMIGRTRPGPDYKDPANYKLIEPGKVFVVGPEISSSDLENQLETVNNNFQKLGLDHFYDTTAPDATHDNLGPQPNGQRIFYRSDHYNFAKNGIPIAFFTDGLHVDYHRVTDSPDKIDYKEIQQVSKTVGAVAWVIGNEPEAALPKINAKLPDQLITDMKAAQAANWGKLTPVLPPLPGMPF